jgi:hypothetical protein
MRAFSEILKLYWSQYDTVMITDGDDIEFYKPIQPLLDMAKTELCVVKEPRLNRAYSIWKPKTKLPLDYWRAIENERTINAGVFAGPAPAVKALLEFMVENMERYSSDFGSEQLSLNIWHYVLGNSVKDAGYAWNCLPLMGTKLVMKARIKSITASQILIDRLGFVLTPFVGVDIEAAVLHLHQDLLQRHFPTRFNRSDSRFRHLLVGDVIHFNMSITQKT